LRPHRRPGWWCWLACCALLLGAAAEAPPAARPVGFAELPGWPGEDPAAALPPLLKSCAVLRTGQTDSAARWARACAAAAALDPARLDAASARAFLERHFRPHALGTGLLTGYYEPELRGARRPGGEFRVPLHGLPPAGPLLQADRAAIEAGALAGRGLEIVYVDDPVDAFFLHIQGSGRVVLRDGGVLRLGFAGRNAHAYHAIGRSLIERGAIPREAMSMQAIRGWLAAAPPAEAAALMRENPAYIFFRAVTGGGPGLHSARCAGVPCQPGSGGRHADSPGGAGAGHRHRHPRPGPGRPVLGLGRRCRHPRRADAGGCGTVRAVAALNIAGVLSPEARQA
jgi:membrane-bound lytic murein transglycosylase A